MPIVGSVVDTVSWNTVSQNGLVLSTVTPSVPEVLLFLFTVTTVTVTVQQVVLSCFGDVDRTLV